MNRVAASLTVRLAVLTSLWVAVGLLAAWSHVSALVVHQIEESFNARLSSLFDAVLAAADMDGSGDPILVRSISEPRFDQPLSGTYWQIEAGPDHLAASRSLWDQRLPSGTARDSGTRITDIAGPRGQHLRLIQRTIVLPDSSTPLHVQVAVARDATDAEISRLRQGLAISFALLGAGLVGLAVATVYLGLRPLRRLCSAVADLRAGRAADLHLAGPSEVQPLIAEIDGLVQQNRATIERARSHVGNLAHALRTRLAVLRNALENRAGPDLALARRELGAADYLVQHHLARARAAALSGSAAAKTDISAVAEEIAQALRRLFADRRLQIETPPALGLIVTCERQDLSEMLGNLMENACKWAQSQVKVTAMQLGQETILLVEDDGAGLPDEQLEEARARGRRLDENAPGAGLGLAIVGDLAELYGGKLELQHSGLGGLATRLTLPSG